MDSITEKKCGSCQTIKSVSEFYTSGRPGYAGTIAGYQSECKKCHNTRTTNKVKETYTVQQGREKNLMKNYGITQAQYDEMYNRQNGRCPICTKLFDSRGGRWVHIDHDHTTGTIRGLLCNHCNGNHIVATTN